MVDKIPQGDYALAMDDSNFRCEMSVIVSLSFTRWSVKEAGYEEEVRKAWGYERLTGQGANVPKARGRETCAWGRLRREADICWHRLHGCHPQKPFLDPCGLHMTEQPSLTMQPAFGHFPVAQGDQCISVSPGFSWL